MLLRSHFIRKFCAEPAAAARLKLDGWAESVRKSGKLVFVTIGDGKQIVVDKELAKGVQVGSPISAIGRWQKSQGDQQEMELVADAFEILGHDSNPRYSADVSADNARKKTHLRARHPEFAAILRSRSLIARATRDFFERLDFVNIDAPKLTRNDAEGGGECFEIKGASTFLTVSSQLHLEAMAAKLERVYTLGTAFRAEKQQSHAHLSEFYMLEAEIAFVQSIDEMCDLIQAYIQTLIHLIEDSPILKSQIAKIGHFRNPEDRPNLEKLLDATWPRIRYEEALEILKIPAGSSEGGGFSKQNELALVEHFGGSPVFVTHFPVDQKPFYMARETSTTTLSFDLLVPIVGELAGGSVRETDVEELKKRGCNIDWYLELRQRGQPPTSGFGIGFERLLQFLFSIRNIKDVIAFPRWYKHCQC